MSIAEEAIAYAKRERNRIARELTDLTIFPPSEPPVTVFMAGSPGAGKTEFSKNLLAEIAKNPQHYPVRIDSDDLRGYIPGYTGKNSSEVQGAVSILVSEMYERVLKNRQTVIFDGTLANYEKAKENIERSIHRQRQVIIVYIYQRPEVAWQFTKERELVEGRNIPKDAFIHQFLQARCTVEKILREFPKTVALFLVRKNYRTNAIESFQQLGPSRPGLDALLPEVYTQQQLENLLV